MARQRPPSLRIDVGDNSAVPARLRNILESHPETANSSPGSLRSAFAFVTDLRARCRRVKSDTDTAMRVAKRTLLASGPNEESYCLGPERRSMLFPVAFSVELPRGCATVSRREYRLQYADGARPRWRRERSQRFNPPAPAPHAHDTYMHACGWLINRHRCAALGLG